MFEYKNVKPLTNIPLTCFKAMGMSRDRDLYEHRLGVTRHDGYFLLKLKADESCAASFTLNGDHLGSYLLGQLMPSPSAVHPDITYYELFIHGGSRDATAFCRTPQEVLKVLTGLEKDGTDSLFGVSDYWEASLDQPFKQLFVEHPQDLRFEMLFGFNSLSGDDHFGVGGIYE